MLLQEALLNPVWLNHEIGDAYTMDGKPDLWKIAYYPILEDAKTKELYLEPRALVEKPIHGGIDFREVPLRYLSKIISHEQLPDSIILDSLKDLNDKNRRQLASLALKLLLKHG